LARFYVRATNRGETPAHGWEIQIAMMDYTGADFVLKHMVTDGTAADDIEPNEAQIFSNNVYPVVIPLGCGPQIIRVWMRYRDFRYPKNPPLTQVIYRTWGGWNNPNLITEISEKDLKPIETMFLRIPTPQ